MEPYLAELRLFAFDKIPSGWLPCEGQTLSIQQNSALFSLLGTTYGGNGQTTFMLPDLRGRAPMHFDSAYPRGASGGEATHTLLGTEMPVHTHQAQASASSASVAAIAGNVWANQQNLFGPAAGLVPMSPSAISKAGGSMPHENMQPYLAMSYCIATQGLYPSRP